MKQTIKWIFVVFGIIVFCLLVGAGFFFWAGTQSANDVRSMCKIEKGTTLEDVVKKAQELKFSAEIQGALGSGLLAYRGTNTEPMDWDGKTTPEFTNGTIQAGKVALPPFMRNYCKLIFQDKKLILTHTWTLN